jgi:hypothetical protein
MVENVWGEPTVLNETYEPFMARWWVGTSAALG